MSYSYIHWYILTNKIFKTDFQNFHLDLRIFDILVYFVNLIHELPKDCTVSWNYLVFWYVIWCSNKRSVYGIVTTPMLMFSRQDRDIEPEDFQHYIEKVEVSLQDCPVERPPAAMLTKESRDSSRHRSGHSRKVQKTKVDCIYSLYICTYVYRFLYSLYSLSFRLAGMSLVCYMACWASLWMLQRQSIPHVTCPPTHQ